MNRQQTPSHRTTFVCGFLGVGMGLFLILTGLGVVPVNPRSANGPLWIATVAGLVFLLAGLSISVGAIHGVSETGEVPKDAGWWIRLFYYLIGLAIVGGLACVGSWVAFGPGLHHFGGPGMFALSPEANNLFGRVIFGTGAVVTWLAGIALAVSGARKLFPRKPA